MNDVKCHGRIVAVGLVCLFNVLRYFYYHQYLALPFKANFFVITFIFLMIALWCGRQYDRMQYLSEKDPLTDTYNRRTVEQYFQKILQARKKENQKLGIIMIDLNKFKEINDTYGHHTGDELLSHFAVMLKKTVQKNDRVARWGGDEFLILVPDIAEDYETVYVRNLQLSIDGFPSISASLGFAIYPDDGENFQELLQHADRAMYEAKGTVLEKLKVGI
ncbi:GGDEF domain-containing protein [Sporosarcina sp. NPDC096371]|uniref:GGDEF domain-containing protein n=1 Tax=Sporosarcina sp. NPDC096371 TaxID=3364530 RepID=UPI003810A6A6